MHKDVLRDVIFPHVWQKDEATRSDFFSASIMQGVAKMLTYWPTETNTCRGNSWSMVKMAHCHGVILEGHNT